MLHMLQGDLFITIRLYAHVIGMTNTSELCMWYESNNRVYGRTNNAYDIRWYSSQHQPADIIIIIIIGHATYV